MRDIEIPSAGLEQEIAAHSAAYDNGEMSLNDYASRGLALAARRYDQRRQAIGGSPALQESLERVLNENKFNGAFRKGYSIRKPEGIDRRSDTVKKATSLIEGVFGENVTDMHYADMQLSGSKVFFNDLEKASLPDEIKATATLLKISYGANAVIRGLIEPMLTGNISSVEEGKEDDFWSGKLVRIRIAQGYLAKVRPLIRDKFAEIHGDEAETAQYLWTLMSFSDVSTNDVETRRKRIAIMKTLGAGNIGQAKELTVQLLAEKPGVVEPRYLRKLTD